jgi:hypothetical protein
METTKGTTMKLTEASLATFKMYAEDAQNWSGNPWVSIGNINPSKEMRGNLSDLSKKGLIDIHGYDNDDTYIVFTDAGEELAKSLGIEIY